MTLRSCGEWLLRCRWRVRGGAAWPYFAAQPSLRDCDSETAAHQYLQRLYAPAGCCAADLEPNPLPPRRRADALSPRSAVGGVHRLRPDLPPRRSSAQPRSAAARLATGHRLAKGHAASARTSSSPAAARLPWCLARRRGSRCCRRRADPRRCPSRQRPSPQRQCGRGPPRGYARCGPTLIAARRTRRGRRRDVVAEASSRSVAPQNFPSCREQRAVWLYPARSPARGSPGSPCRAPFPSRRARHPWFECRPGQAAPSRSCPSI